MDKREKIFEVKFQELKFIDNILTLGFGGLAFGGLSNPEMFNSHNTLAIGALFVASILFIFFVLTRKKLKDNLMNWLD